MLKHLAPRPMINVAFESKLAKTDNENYVLEKNSKYFFKYFGLFAVIFIIVYFNIFFNL